MAVDFVAPLIKGAVDLLTHALAYSRRRLGKKKYEQLLSTTIAELLKEHPDIDEAKARIAALEATGVAPSPDLLRVKSMLKAVETHFRRRAKGRSHRKVRKRRTATRK
ncbi:MAG TPA: hypothetical protein VJW76_09585 [Verrucomicrobiae bacterium]|nr:hypothetical protein [Verrucomicrobiae bacterium]